MPGINKIKKLHFLNKKESKIILALAKTKEKYIHFLKKKRQQIIKLVRSFACLGSVHATFMFEKSCSSNYLVTKIKSIAALRILELLLELSDKFSKSKVCVK